MAQAALSSPTLPVPPRLQRPDDPAAPRQRQRRARAQRGASPLLRLPHPRQAAPAAEPHAADHALWAQPVRASGSAPGTRRLSRQRKPGRGTGWTLAPSSLRCAGLRTLRPVPPPDVPCQLGICQGAPFLPPSCCRVPEEPNEPSRFLKDVLKAGHAVVRDSCGAWQPRGAASVGSQRQQERRQLPLGQRHRGASHGRDGLLAGATTSSCRPASAWQSVTSAGSAGGPAAPSTPTSGGGSSESSSSGSGSSSSARPPPSVPLSGAQQKARARGGRR